MSDSTYVLTRLGRLHVERQGAGPPAVLWHSLFVDSTTWRAAAERWQSERSLVLIDGPGHGQSGHAAGPYNLVDCADAALEVLTALGVTGPADWVGNAWGGHVGLQFAARHPERVRSLVTVGTPVHAISRAQRLRVAPLVALYGRIGPRPFLSAAVAQALLGKPRTSAELSAYRTLRELFAQAPRAGMHQAMVSVMMRREHLGPELGRVRAPTLMLRPSQDPLLTADQVQAAVALLPGARSAEVPGHGHVAPLMLAPDDVAAAVSAHWRGVPPPPLRHEPNA